MFENFTIGPSEKTQVRIRVRDNCDTTNLFVLGEVKLDLARLPAPQRRYDPLIKQEDSESFINMLDSAEPKNISGFWTLVKKEKATQKYLAVGRILLTIQVLSEKQALQYPGCRKNPRDDMRNMNPFLRVPIHRKVENVNTFNKQMAYVIGISVSILIIILGFYIYDKGVFLKDALFAYSRVTDDWTQSDVAKHIVIIVYYLMIALAIEMYKN